MGLWNFNGKARFHGKKDEDKIKVTNVGLYNILSQYFGECWYDGSAAEHSNERIGGVIVDLFCLLHEYHEQWADGDYFKVLTFKQVHFGTEAINLAEQEEYVHSLYALMECIGNDGEVYRAEREITPNEYMLYYSVVTALRCHMAEKMN